MSNFLNGIAERPSAIHAADVESATKSKTDRLPRRQPRQKVAETCVYAEEREEYAHSPYQSNTADVVRELTPSQEAIWQEYCRLIGWKDHFYQAWWHAMTEYQTALEQFKQGNS